MKNVRIRNTILIIAAIGIVFGVAMLVPTLSQKVGETTPAAREDTARSLPDLDLTETEEKKEKAGEDKEKRVKLVAVGDMLMHVPVSGYAKQADGSYNYDFIFEPIKKELSEADLAVVNNEVPFGGNQYGLRGYPSFNVYTELGDAEVKAGFNVILNASNHVNDMGYQGIQNTLKFWEKYPDVTLLGLNKTQSDVGKLVIKEVNGIKIAMFNYVYGINAGIPAQAPYAVNMMTKDTQAKMKQEIMRAEKEADITIVFPHWGEEYHLMWSPGQELYAKMFTEWGADLIIGTHPHCCEPIRTITASNGNTSLCYYSLGNFISEQDETIAMIGGVAKVDIVKDENGTRIDSHDIQFVINHFGQKADAVKLYRLEDYNDDLARQHGIVLNQWNGGELNYEYPFNMTSIKKIIENMMSDHPKETQLVHVEQRWGEKKNKETTAAESETSTDETGPEPSESSTEPTSSDPSETPAESSTDVPPVPTEPSSEPSTEPPATEPPAESGTET